jgi:tetratricopeptide (TPR) repeat protein
MGGIAKLMRASELAIPFFERAIQLYFEHAIIYAQYGRYLTTINRTEEAINKLKTALHLDPTLNAAYVWLAETYLKSGRPELASQVLEDAPASKDKNEIPIERSGK